LDALALAKKNKLEAIEKQEAQRLLDIAAAGLSEKRRREAKEREDEEE